ncbi:unnamed protein product [Cercopithifilaria johnstoni]|uniref:Uncharacterized protein n=1 Tax=Cercopithifilaria johnstoni TaxID=2874296 RepID=A0A8J2LQR7_9BILA|nr:unnamed protein product [Cercopithifilaria johnstoni]
MSIDWSLSDAVATGGEQGRVEVCLWVRTGRRQVNNVRFWVCFRHELLDYFSSKSSRMVASMPSALSTRSFECDWYKAALPPVI